MPGHTGEGFVSPSCVWGDLALPWANECPIEEPRPDRHPPRNCAALVKPFWSHFAAEIRRKRVDSKRRHTHWRWHLDEVYMKINGQMHYLWRAVDHEGEVLKSFASKQRDKAAALKFIKSVMKRHGKPD